MGGNFPASPAPAKRRRWPAGSGRNWRHGGRAAEPRKAGWPAAGDACRPPGNPERREPRQDLRRERQSRRRPQQAHAGRDAVIPAMAPFGGVHPRQGPGVKIDIDPVQPQHRSEHCRTEKGEDRGTGAYAGQRPRLSRRDRHERQEHKELLAEPNPWPIVGSGVVVSTLANHRDRGSGASLETKTTPEINKLPCTSIPKFTQSPISRSREFRNQYTRERFR